MKNQRIIGVIPARYQSSRLPGKPLSIICGKSMIQRVYENCLKSKTLDMVVVATDDERIAANVKSFGGKVVMTSVEISTGTARCLAAIGELSCDYVVNIQGDEPLIDPSVIDETVRAMLESKECVCATPITLIREEGEILSPNCVKAVFNRNMEALYFSRSAVPYYRDLRRDCAYYKHIGLYVYSRSFLQEYVLLEQTPLELAESLEQLRILENGFRIKCCKVAYEAIGVDTAEDLAKVREIIASQQ